MNSETIFFSIITALVLIYFLRNFFKDIYEYLSIFMGWKTDYNKHDLEKPSIKTVSKPKIKNDKLIIVNDISSDEIDKILMEYCVSESIQTRLYTLSERKFALTFPYDIDFEAFCVFINYIRYPIFIDRYTEVFGWTTTKSGQMCITERSANKKVMLYIPFDNDGEISNLVHLTTIDNIGYKLDFRLSQKAKLLDFPKLKYAKPQITNKDLSFMTYKEY